MLMFKLREKNGTRLAKREVYGANITEGDGLG
jgi:hypothetical protein